MRPCAKLPQRTLRVKESLGCDIGTGMLFEYNPNMVSDEDREHFRRIAAIEEELNRESIHAAAARTPGDNIALGLELSEFAAAFGGDVFHPDEPPLIQLWRARREKDDGQG
jgi:hypothetical protein